MSSSTRDVAAGSRALVGSSISKTSGSTAMALAIHSRCCCPPDKSKALLLSLFCTSSHNPAAIKAVLTFSCRRRLSFMPCKRRP
uniref:Uncharacterized protein n=1 Tax=Coprothermobacter proteolyticus (strain ATCC 35245 / DSM 5265 / OCM 4 / BT) TaxID=309798 RepID=B5Y9L5_COPPD